MFNKITKGGLGKKTLNIALAGTGVGKSSYVSRGIISFDDGSQRTVHHYGDGRREDR